VQACLAAGRRTDEVRRRAGVEECRELLGAHGDAHLHGVFAADACDGIEGDERLLFVRDRLLIQ
jgi:hypothetical protein